VKGTGESAIAAILAARSDGPFRDLFDFCERVDKRIVNRRTVEALVRAGAFDGVNAGDHSARAGMLASVGIALESAEQTERNAKQVSLFGSAKADRSRSPRSSPRRGGKRRSACARKRRRSASISRGTLHAHRAEIGRFVRTSLRSLAAAEGESGTRTQLIAGWWNRYGFRGLKPAAWCGEPVGRHRDPGGHCI